MTVASATPGASRVPKSLATGKLDSGWMSPSAILADLGLTGLAAGALIYATGAATVDKLTLGTTGRLLVAGATAPEWSDSGLSYASGVLTVAGSVPATPSSGQVVIGGGEVKAGAGISGTTLTASDTITGSLGTITAAKTALALSAKWNNAAIVFTGINFNATSTASSADSKLLDLNVGGTTVYAVTRDNAMVFGGGCAAFPGSTYDSYGIILVTGATGSYPFNNAGSMVYRARLSSVAGRSSHIFYTGATPSERVRINETGQLLVGAAAGVGAELALFSGGTAPGTPSATQVMIGAGAVTCGAGISCTTLTASGAISQTGGQYHYLRGDGSTNGSVRLSSPSSGTFSVEARAGGSWASISGGSSFATAITTTDDTQSTSTATGSLIVAGGAGIAKNANVGGNVFADGTVSSGYDDKQNAAIVASGSGDISGANLGDGKQSAIRLTPYYTGAHTVTRHNYLELQNPGLESSAAVTDACVFMFDKNAGTHKAVDSSSTKTTPGGVDAWVKINVNGTVYYMPAYTSKTA